MSRAFCSRVAWPVWTRLLAERRLRFLPLAGTEAIVVAALLVALTLFAPASAPAAPPADFTDTAVLSSPARRPTSPSSPTAAS